MSSLSNIQIWKQKNTMRIDAWLQEVQLFCSQCMNEHWKTLLKNHIIAHDIPEPFDQFVLHDHFDIFIKHDAICQEKWLSCIKKEREKLQENIMYAEAEAWRLHFMPEGDDAAQYVEECKNTLMYFDSWVNFWDDANSRYTFLVKAIADISLSAWVPFLDGTSLEDIKQNIDYFSHLAQSDKLMLQTLEMYPSLYWEHSPTLTPYPTPLELLQRDIIERWEAKEKTTITSLFNARTDGLVLYGL